MNRDEERQLCETYYSRAIAGAATDEEELAVALALLEKAEKGFVVNDSGKGQIYFRQPDLPVDADYMIDEDSPRQKVRRALPGIVVLVIALAVVLIRYGGGGGAVQPTATHTTTTAVAVRLPTMTLTAAPTRAVTPTATPTTTPSPMPSDTPTPAPPREVEVKPEPVKIEPEAVIPVSLEVTGRYFPVVPTTLRDDVWAYLPQPDRVSWLAGSYVNIILGLPYTPENLDLLVGTLAVSDTLTLRSSVGGTTHYRAVERRQVDLFEIEVLSQRRAGLTLVLLGGPAGPLAELPGRSEDNKESIDRRLVVWAVPVEIETEIER